MFQDKDEHLELMDGVLIDLLNAKWNTFVKFKFYRQFFTFAFYFLISLVAFTLRPGPPVANKTTNSTNPTLSHLANGTKTKNTSVVETVKLFNITHTSTTPKGTPTNFENYFISLFIKKIIRNS